MSAEPTISIVVPTFDRADELPALIASLEQQRAPFPFEVVIVNDGSRDDSGVTLGRLVAASALSLVVVRLDSNRGPAAARNVGWRRAAAPLVAFTDDDCRPRPDWLAQLVAGLTDADLVQGVTVPDPDEAERLGPFARSLEVTTEGLYPTCNVAYRRTVLEAMYGFDERFRKSCDDTDLAWRAREWGARTAFVPEAVVYHRVHEYDYRQLLAEKFRWDGVALVLRKHPGLRSYLHSPFFWRASHPPALCAAAGLAVSGFALTTTGARRTRIGAAALGVALLVPYYRFRTRVWPLPKTRASYALLPKLLAADLVEVGVMAAASARYRSLVL